MLQVAQEINFSDIWCRLARSFYAE